MLGIGLLETPRPGDIIRYRYLWTQEAKDGYDGRTPRECLVLHVAQVGDRHECLVLPISKEPVSTSKIMEIPDSVRQAAGLDDYNRYLVYGEANAFLWPSLDVIPVKTREYNELIRGRMSHGFYEGVKDAYTKEDVAKKGLVVDRGKLEEKDVNDYRKRRDARAYGR